MTTDIACFANHASFANLANIDNTADLDIPFSLPNFFNPIDLQNLSKEHLKILK